MLSWNEGFCTELVARGLQPIRFDNRDADLSSHFPNPPALDFNAAMVGDTSSASYSLSDMAADTVGLLDTLDLECSSRRRLDGWLYRPDGRHGASTANTIADFHDGYHR
jgi:hypothetical protein